MIPSRNLEDTAVHEAAHAVAGILHHRRVALVRITRNEAGEAVCMWADTDRPPIPTTTEPMYAGPAFSLPTAMRSMLERDIIVTLAAEEAIRLRRYSQLEPGEAIYNGPAPSELAEWKARARAGLPLEAQQLAAVNDVSEGGMSDDDKVFGLVVSITGRLSGAYLRWLREETVELVTSEPFQLGLRALVPVLLERGEMAGAEVHDVVENALGWRRRWLKAPEVQNDENTTTAGRWEPAATTTYAAEAAA